MTTQTAVFSGLPTGLTLTKKVFTEGDPDTEVTGITGAVTERTNAKGQYIVAVTKSAVITGVHTLILFVGSVPVAIGKRTFAGTDGETAIVTPEAVALDPALTETIGKLNFNDNDALNVNVMYYNDTPQSNGDLPLKMDAVLSAVNNLNNLSALINIYGSPMLEVPDSGSTPFAFTVVVRDNEGKLVNLDSAPTIAAANAAGTDRSGNLSSVSSPATGRYTFTYSVASNATRESLRITCSGTVSAEGRYIEWIGTVVDYDSLTTLLAIKSRTDNLPSDPADQSELEVYIDGAVASIQGSQQSAAAAAIAAYDPPTNAEMVARTLPAADYATLSGLTAVLTKIRKFFQLALRKDVAIATDNATELTEINANGGTGGGGYLNTTDSQESIRDRGDSAWGSSGGGSVAESTLLLSTTVASVTSPTVLVLSEGTGENDAYNRHLVVITDADTATQKSSVAVADYVGGSKTLTLNSVPTFTVAAGDLISIIAVGSMTALQEAKIDRIEDATSSITGTPLRWVGNVAPGGIVYLTVGDDHVTVVSNQLSIPIVDAGGSMHAKLNAEGVTVQWGAGQDITGGKIIGEFVESTYTDGVTTVVIEVPECQPTGNIRLPYKWQLQRTLSNKKATLAQGDLHVRPDMIEVH